MSYKKLLQELSPQELAESFVFPVKLSAKQQKAADLLLTEARQKVREKMTDTEKLTGRLMGLKFRMEDYFRADKPNSEYSFGLNYIQTISSLLNIGLGLFKRTVKEPCY